MAHLGKVLIQERMPEPMSRIGEKRTDRTALDRGIKLVHALDGGKVSLNRIDGSAESLELLCGLMNGSLIGRDQQVIAILGAELGKLIADAD